MPWNGNMHLSQSPSIKHHLLSQTNVTDILTWDHQGWLLAAWLLSVHCLKGGQWSVQPFDSTSETAEWNGSATDQKQRGRIWAIKVSASLCQKIPHNIYYYYLSWRAFYSSCLRCSEILGRSTGWQDTSHNCQEISLGKRCFDHVQIFL